MDKFDTVSLEGNENIVGKNIIYKSHIVIELCRDDKYGKITDTCMVLLFLLLTFIGSLLAIGCYLGCTNPKYLELLIISLLIISFVNFLLGITLFWLMRRISSYKPK